MEPTTNIPKSLPIVCDEDFAQQIMEWVTAQPTHELDEKPCRHERWTYQITESGMSSNIVVRDNFTKETFTPIDDPTKW